MRAPQDRFSVFSPHYDWFMRFFNLYRLDDIRRALAEHAPYGALLDVAGGTGYLAAALRDMAGCVVVVDRSPGMLAVARERKLETVLASATALPFADASFDVVLCADALHHIREAEAALDEMARVLKPGGTALVQEFHIHGVRGMMFYLFERLLIDHSVFVAPNELLEMMARRGIVGCIRKLSGLGYLFEGMKQVNERCDHD